MYCYICKRCKKLMSQKIEMERHLSKIVPCAILDKNNTFTDAELYRMSMEKIVLKDSSDDDSKNIPVNYCERCDKFFHNRSNLIKHLRKNVCEKNIEKRVKNTQNIGIQNIMNGDIHNTNQNIVININYPRGFDEDWDVSKIDNNLKEKLLMSDTKFSKTLENILENERNLNVILCGDDAGVVFKTNKNKYEPMSINDIIEKSMEKIFGHLLDFCEDIKKSEKEIKDNELIDYITKNLKIKYRDFTKVEKIKELVKNSFSSIYNERKEMAEKKYLEIQKIEDDPDQINDYKY